MPTIKIDATHYLVTTDDRGRATLPKELTRGHRRYRVTEDKDGTLTLTPVTLTDTTVPK